MVATGAAAGALLITILIHGSGDVGSFWSTLGDGIPRVIFSFLLGVGLCRWRSIKATRVGSLGSAGLCLGLGICLLAYPSGPARPAFDAVFDLAISPAIILAGSVLEPPRSAIPIARWLGAVSYPIYAIHWPLMLVFDQLVTAQAEPPALLHIAFLSGVIGLGAVLAVSYDPWARRGLRGVGLAWKAK